LFSFKDETFLFLEIFKANRGRVCFESPTTGQNIEGGKAFVFVILLSNSSSPCPSPPKLADVSPLSPLGFL
jgi:hypothetical protein